MRRFLQFVLTYLTTGLLLAVSLPAAPVAGTVLETSCQAPGLSISGAQSCLADPSGLAAANGLPSIGYPYAYATANLSSRFAPDDEGFSDVHALQTTKLGQGWADPGSTVTAPVAAVSSLQFSEQLETSGPVRLGYLQMSLDDNSLGYASTGSGSGLFQLSLLSAGIPQATTFGCAISLSSCSDVARAEQLTSLGGMPVLLGISFTLSYSGLLQSFAGGYADGNGSGTLDLDFRFRLLEADGTTPVAILTAAPEPGTLGILGAALLTLGLLKRRRN